MLIDALKLFQYFREGSNTFILIGSSVTMVMAWASLKLHDWAKHRLYLILTFVLAGVIALWQAVFGFDASAEGPAP